MSMVRQMAKKRMFKHMEDKGYMPKIPGMALGGEVSGEASEDEMWGDYDPHNSSGEPHTNDRLEEESPEEFEDHGEIEHYAHGGVAGMGENFPTPMAEDEDDDVSMSRYGGESGNASTQSQLHDEDVEPDYDLERYGGESNFPNAYEMNGKNVQVYPAMAKGGMVPGHGMAPAAAGKAHGGYSHEFVQGAEAPMPHMAAGGSMGKLGSGKRFSALEGKLAHKPGIYDPAGLAASIGRKSLGKERFQNLAAKGRARASKMAHGGMAFAHALKKYGK